MTLDRTLERELAIAKEAAVRAGRMLVAGRHEDLRIQQKDDGSPVCIGDKRSSDFLMTYLSQHFPEYGMLCEEDTSHDTRSQHEYSWIIDPLDGTYTYINGDVGYGVIIGLCKGSEAVLGVTFRPEVNELLYATQGNGAFTELYDGSTKRLEVAQTDQRHLLVTGDRDNQEIQDVIDKVCPDSTYRMYTAFKVTHIAQAKQTLYINPRSIHMNLWDLCGGAVIASEAGGRITDIHGRPIDYRGEETLREGLVISNRIIHDDVLHDLAA